MASRLLWGGDWQVSPFEVRRSDLLKVLDAEVVETGLPTNTVTGNELDFFVVSRTLLSKDLSNEIEASGAFSPHVAVRLNLHIPIDEGITRRLKQPRLLPIERPIGPLQNPEYLVDWGHWDRDRRRAADLGSDNCLIADASTINRVTNEWYAGAEVELLQAHAIDICDGAPYSGMGQAPVMVQTGSRGRFRNVASEAGLFGQRLAWAARALWGIIALMGSPVGSDYRIKALALAWRMSPRARAFRRELDRRSETTDYTTHSILRRALVVVGQAGLTVHGIPPLLQRLAHTTYDDVLDKLRELYNTVNAALLELIAEKNMHFGGQNVGRAARPNV